MGPSRDVRQYCARSWGAVAHSWWDAYLRLYGLLKLWLPFDIWDVPQVMMSLFPQDWSQRPSFLFPCGWNTGVWPSLHQWVSLTKDYNSETNGVKKKVCGAPSLVRVAAEMAILQTQQDRGPVIPLAVQSVGSLASGGSSVILTGADLWYNWGIVPGGGASKPGFLILPPTPENILIFMGEKKAFL